MPPGPGTAPGRIAADRLRHGRADRHARGPARGHRAHVAAVAVLPRPRGAAADGRASPTISRCGWSKRGAEPSLVAALRAIDFYFLNLSQLRAGADRGLSALRRGSPARAEERAMRLLGPLRRDRGPPGGRAAPPPGRAAGRQADRPRQLHAERRRRGRNPGLDGPADAGVGDRRPLGSHHRPARLLSRHQGLSQRLAGPAGVAARRAISICTTRSIGRTPSG